MRYTKVVLRGRYIALNAYIRKEERFKMNYLSFHLRNLEKEEQKIKQKIIIKMRAEINETENRKSIEKNQ